MKPVLVAVSFVARGTGFGCVSRSILERLGGDFDVHVCGLGPADEASSTNGMTIHPASPSGGDPYGTYHGKALIEDLGASLVWLYNDIWILKNYAPMVQQLRPRPRIVISTLLDGRLADDALTSGLPPADRLVVCSEFGRRELQGSIERIRSQGHRVPVDRVDVVPYGVDTKAFRLTAGDLGSQLQPNGRRATKQAVFPSRPDLWDSFLVLNGNRPRPRKRLDLTLAAFALFARHTPPSVRLVLHNAATTSQDRIELRSMAETLGIGDRLEFLDGHASFLDIEWRNQLYNACEVGINTSMGEGWGLVSLEHAATGGAQIVPGHSASGELWRGAAAILPPSAPVQPAFSPLLLASVSHEHAADALGRLYREPDYRRELSCAGFHRATDPRLGWGNIASSWQRLFRHLLESSPIDATEGNARSRRLDADVENASTSSMPTSR